MFHIINGVISIESIMNCQRYLLRMDDLSHYVCTFLPTLEKRSCFHAYWVYFVGGKLQTTSNVKVRVPRTSPLDRFFLVSYGIIYTPQAA